MKPLLWLGLAITVGVGLGFVAAHRVNSTPRGRRFFEQLNARALAVREAAGDGYRARESELRAAIGNAENAVTELGR